MKTAQPSCDFINNPPKIDSRATPPAELSAPGASAESLKNETTAQAQKTKLQKTNSRYIPAALRREVWKIDHGRCSYQSADGKKCLSRYALEIDHVEPLALGGQTKPSHLRLLCRAHNQQQALIKLGPQTMMPFMSH